MDALVLDRLVDMLLNSARKRGVLPYARFHALFPHTMTLSARQAMLDEALRVLGNDDEIDYGVLFARDNGLPGPDFFKRYRANRPSEYAALVGDPRYRNATFKQQRQIAATERERVYEHAARRASRRLPLVLGA